MSKGYQVGGSIRPTFLDEERVEIGDNRKLYVRSSRQHDSLVEVQFDNNVRVTVNAADLISLIQAVTR